MTMKWGFLWQLDTDGNRCLLYTGRVENRRVDCKDLKGPVVPLPSFLHQVSMSTSLLSHNMWLEITCFRTLVPCLLSFPVTVTKPTDEINLREEGLIFVDSPGIQSILAGKPDATGHAASTMRKQRETNASPQLCGPGSTSFMHPLLIWWTLHPLRFHC